MVVQVGADQGSIRWARIRHESVGGASHFVALVCSTTHVDPTISILDRTLYHIVDHGVRPLCIRESYARYKEALTVQDRIHPSNLGSQVVYATHFCFTGWGYWCLTPGELSQVYGLPMLCRYEGLCKQDFEPLIPAHIFQGLHDQLWIATDVANSRGVSQPRNHRLPLFKFPCSTRSWISSIGRWLTHEWIDCTQVTSKASKRDDAVIAIDMWDKLLLLLYPKCSSHHLNTLRTWLLVRVTRLICRGLRAHL
jgi:hypothetical protein